ncbi:MAG: nicotinate-nucleotide adenylyltransferase [Candidatus Symbiodolus clandestinus]
MHALLGGTFDPIHRGHLHIGQAVAQQLSLSQIALLPNRQPYYRSPPQTSAEQRLCMLHLAIIDQPLFTIDDRELRLPTLKYTVQTLQAIRQGIGDRQPLLMIIGEDAWLNLPQWHQWQRLLDYSHLIICHRPGYRTHHLPVHRAWGSRQVGQPQRLHEKPHGYFYLANVAPIPISATMIRQRLQKGLSCNDWLPLAVADYIQQHQLYR